MAGGAVDEPGADPKEPRQSVAILSGIAIVALLIWLGMSNIWSLVLVAGLLISVFLHEVGHFVTAGWAGMKRTQFFMDLSVYGAWSTGRHLQPRRRPPTPLPHPFLTR